MAQRFAPQVQPVATFGDHHVDEQTSAITSLFASAAGVRRLLLGVILVAWFPSVIVGATFWLKSPGGSLRSAKSTILAGTSPRDVASGEAAITLPVVTAPVVLEAKAGEDVSFPLALDGTDGVPARSMIAISGLPPGTTFSNGRPYGEKEWTLKSDEIGDLHLFLPDTASGESRVVIQLIAAGGDLIADANTILRVTEGPNTFTGSTGNAPLETEPADKQVSPAQSNADGTTGTNEKLANLQTAQVAPENSLHMPSHDIAPAMNDNVPSNWVVLSSFVNLREGPSSSAPVIHEMPKGAKLPALDRKHGWVQVTDPATSTTGWIYARNVATASTSPRAKRHARSKVRPEADDSIWTNLGQWLSTP
jgi:hypothetical protein